MINKVTLYEKIIREAIDKVLLEEQPRSLFDPARYILSLGGKRLRPLLTLMAVDLFGKEVKKAVNPALAIEIFHNFSLLHDDLMDNADLTPAHPTPHMSWNANSPTPPADPTVTPAHTHIPTPPAALLPDPLNPSPTPAPPTRT